MTSLLTPPEPGSLPHVERRSVESTTCAWVCQTGNRNEAEKGLLTEEIANRLKTVAYNVWPMAESRYQQSPRLVPSMDVAHG